MASSQFDTSFESILSPTLSDLGFARIRLKDCMHPEYLFRKSTMWFGLSWDYRDFYLAVSLGKLHWFSDVMPRVVVIGDYSNFEPSITPSSINAPDDIRPVFETIAETLEAAVMECESDYEQLFQDFRVSRSRSRNVHIDEFIGPEVTDSDLSKYLA